MKAWPVMIFLISNFSLTPAMAGAKMGAGSSGGGDSYVLDFIKTANQNVLPWLKQNEETLNLNIDESDFKAAVNPREILSIDRVYESCNGSKEGREVEACYSSETNLIYLSRERYNLNDRSDSKLGIVAHEVFRKLGVEGDRYEVTSKITESLTVAGAKAMTPGEYKALGNFCNAHLEVNKSRNSTEFIVTFINKTDLTTGRTSECLYYGKTWIFAYNSDEDIYESDALIGFKPLSDGNFVLRDIPMSSGKLIDIKFIK